MQINHITKVAYTKQNELLLQVAHDDKQYQSDEWLTFLQARENGLQIKKGSKGVYLVRVFDTDKTDTKGEMKKAIKGFVVFNLDQTQPAVVPTVAVQTS